MEEQPLAAPGYLRRGLAHFIKAAAEGVPVPAVAGSAALGGRAGIPQAVDHMAVGHQPGIHHLMIRNGADTARRGQLHRGLPLMHRACGINFHDRVRRAGDDHRFRRQTRVRLCLRRQRA